MLDEICKLNELLETSTKVLNIAEEKVKDLRDEVKCNREQTWEEVVKPILAEMQATWAKVPDKTSCFSPAIALHDIYSGAEMLTIRFDSTEHFMLSEHVVSNRATFKSIEDDKKVMLLIDRWADFEDEIINGMVRIVKNILKRKGEAISKEYSDLRQKLGYTD